MFVNYYEKCSLSCKYFFKILFGVSLEKRESNNSTWINDDSCINYYYYYDAEHWTFFIRTKAMQMMSDSMDDCTLQLPGMRNGAIAECSIRLILWIISDWIRIYFRIRDSFDLWVCSGPFLILWIEMAE